MRLLSPETHPGEHRQSVVSGPSRTRRDARGRQTARLPRPSRRTFRLVRSEHPVDGSRFDDFARTFVTSRRGALKTLLGGAAAGIAAVLVPETAGMAQACAALAAALRGGRRVLLRRVRSGERPLRLRRGHGGVRSGLHSHRAVPDRRGQLRRLPKPLPAGAGVPTAGLHRGRLRRRARSGPGRAAVRP